MHDDKKRAQDENKMRTLP